VRLLRWVLGGFVIGVAGGFAVALFRSHSPSRASFPDLPSQGGGAGPGLPAVGAGRRR